MAKPNLHLKATSEERDCSKSYKRASHPYPKPLWEFNNLFIFEMQLSVVKMLEGSINLCQRVLQSVLPSQLITTISWWQLYAYSLVKKMFDFWLVLKFIMACSFSLFSFCSNPWVVSSEAIQ